MIYSVWNRARRVFDYYQTSEVGPTHAPTAQHIQTVQGLGATPEEAAWQLPAGARKIGSGPTARGRVASLGSLESGHNSLMIGTLLIAGYLIGRKVLR